MPETRPVFITRDDVDVVQDDQVRVNSPELVELLIKDHAGGTQFLSEAVGGVDLSGITILDDGRILLRNQSLAQLRESPGSAQDIDPMGVKNVACGAGC